MARSSIARTLSRGLLVVGLVGMGVLLTIIVIDYHITFGGLRDPQALQRAVYEVGAHVLLPAILIALPMALVGWHIVRRAMRPIEDAAAAVAAAERAPLGVRIEAGEFPAEIAPLAEGVNALLTRMEDIACGNEAFAADVAHELRTPLTLLGLEIERLDHPNALALLRQVHDMQKLVGQLMTIAQLQLSEKRREAGQIVDLAALGARVVAQLAPAALASGRTLAFEELGPVDVRGVPEALAAALRNLVDNALRVTPAGGQVTVIAGPGPVLGVADGGSGLSSEQLERLSSRHARADHASRDGAGLGLSIARKIMEVHGGRIATDPEMRRISLHFPAGPAELPKPSGGCQPGALVPVSQSDAGIGNEQMPFDWCSGACANDRSLRQAVGRWQRDRGASQRRADEARP